MFVSAHESVRKAVEAALPQLRASLAEQGISLGQASVGAEAHRFAGQGGAFDQQAQQQQGSGRQPQYPAPGRAEAAALAEPLHGGLPPAAPRTLQRRRRHLRMRRTRDLRPFPALDQPFVCRAPGKE